MRRWQPLLLLTLLTLPGLLRGGENYTLETKPVQRIEAVLTFEIATPNFKADRWLVYVAKPPELPSQVKVRSVVEPKCVVIQDASPYRRQVFAVNLPALTPELQRKFRVKVKYQATLLSRRLVSLSADEPPPTVKPLDAAERRRALAATAKINFKDKAFEKWLDTNDLKRQDKESEIDFGVRVLSVLRSFYTYAFYNHDRSAGHLAGLDRTDCAGLSVMFVAACRANGIPARMLIGRLAKSRVATALPTSPDHTRAHVRVELFAEGVGWVPAEPNLANVDKAKPVATYMGYDHADLLVFHVDEGFLLPEVKDAIDSLQVPGYASIGKGTLDGRKDLSDWQVRTVAMDEELAGPAGPAADSSKGDADRVAAEARRKAAAPDQAEARRKEEERAGAYLRFAKKLISNAEIDKGRQRLEEIIKEHPETKAAQEARELLDKLPQ